MLLAACGGSPAPDLILTEGRVFTADSVRPWAEAVAVSEGRIETVGSSAEIGKLAGSETHAVDLEGRLVVPGLVDAHEHVVWPDPDGVRLELPADGPLPDPSWSEVLTAVEDAAAEAPEGAWIHGTIGPSVLSDPEADRFSLDEVSVGRPVKLTAFTGHGMLLSSAALERLGIGSAPEDPPGGWYGRVDGERTLDGWLWEYAQFAAERRRVERVPTSAGVEQVRAFVSEAVGWGVTSVHETGSPYALAEHLEILETAAPEIRWTVYRLPLPADSLGIAPRDTVTDAMSPDVRLGGVKWILDGTPVEGNVLRRRPGVDGEHGRMNFTRDEVRRILAGALERGEQPALHVAGDSSLALVLGTMEELASPDPWRELRVRIEHGDGLGGDLVERASRLGVVLVQNPLHFESVAALVEASDADPAEVGPPQALRSAREAGVRVALGSDADGIARNPWLNLMLAVTHPARPGEALSRKEALIAYTRGGAYAEGADDRKGRLVPGAAADLTVLSQNVFEVPLERLSETRSLLTLVGGEIVHRSDEMREATDD
ncbi:MAG: amidohydrolase [Gemmatimonadota bacterium]